MEWPPSGLWNGFAAVTNAYHIWHARWADWPLHYYVLKKMPLISALLFLNFITTKHTLGVICLVSFCFVCFSIVNESKDKECGRSETNISVQTASKQHETASTHGTHGDPRLLQNRHPVLPAESAELR